MRGFRGTGKFVAACQAAQAMFAPAKKGEQHVPGTFQSIYAVDLEGCKDKDAIDSA